jgi:hypothetical protein
MAGGPGVVAVPTVARDTTVGVVLSAWKHRPPEGPGIALGRIRLETPGARLRTVAFDDPGGLALPLPEPGAYEVKARRRLEPGGDFEYERYDVRAWPAAGGRRS